MLDEVKEIYNQAINIVDATGVSYSVAGGKEMAAKIKARGKLIETVFKQLVKIWRTNEKDN